MKLFCKHPPEAIRGIEYEGNIYIRCMVCGKTPKIFITESKTIEIPDIKTLRFYIN